MKYHLCMAEDGKEITEIPANIKAPKMKREISMKDANEYGLTILKSAFPYLLAIFLCFFVSDYMADWSLDVNDDEEQAKELLGISSVLFRFLATILSIGLTIGISYKVISDAVTLSLNPENL